MDEALILQAGKSISARLREQLDDFYAESITLTREEAVLAIGFVDAAVEQLEKDAARKA